MKNDEDKTINALLQILEHQENNPYLRTIAGLLLFTMPEAMQSEEIKREIVKVFINTVNKVDSSAVKNEVIQRFILLEAYEAEEQLLHLVKYDDSNEIKKEAMYALKMIGKNRDKIAKTLIFSARYGSDNYVQRTAINTIGDLKLLSATDDLIILLSSHGNDQYYVEDIISALKKLNKIKEAVEPLLNILNKPGTDINVIGVIVNELISIDDEKIITPFVNLMNDPSISDDSSVKKKIKEYLVSKETKAGSTT